MVPFVQGRYSQRANLRLFVQPGSGVQPLVDAIDGAKHRVEIVIFRLDRTEVEHALIRAVNRGVFVHALIAYTNRGGHRNLRHLEMRLLSKGVNVARTADDLVRYHSKFMIIDGRELWVLAFNFTILDMEHSRSFAVVTHNAGLVAEAEKLFQADTKRTAYHASNTEFVVSPVNAREELSAFIQKAEKQLLIYDPKVAEPGIIRLLEARVNAGVDVRIVGQVARGTKLASRDLVPIRLHTRSILRDRSHVFIGSQSLRTAELEVRREVGIIFKDAKIAKEMICVFEEDWRLSADYDQFHGEGRPQARKVAKRFAKAITKGLPPMGAVLELIVREMTGPGSHMDVNTDRLERAVKDAVKEAVEESVREAVQDAVDSDR